MSCILEKTLVGNNGRGFGEVKNVRPSCLSPITFHNHLLHARQTLITKKMLHYKPEVFWPGKWLIRVRVGWLRTQHCSKKCSRQNNLAWRQDSFECEAGAGEGWGLVYRWYWTHKSSENWPFWRSQRRKNCHQFFPRKVSGFSSLKEKKIRCCGLLWE